MKRPPFALCLFVVAVGLLPAAEDAEAPVQLPAMRVPATKLERFTVVNALFPSGVIGLMLRPGPTKPDMLAILVGGALPGDQIVSIDGKEVGNMKRGEWTRELNGNFKLVLKRSTGRKTFRLVEADGRPAP